MSFMKPPTGYSAPARPPTKKHDAALDFFNYQPEVVGQGEFLEKEDYEVHLVKPLSELRSRTQSVASSTVEKTTQKEMGFIEEALKIERRHSKFNQLKEIAKKMEERVLEVNKVECDNHQAVKKYNELVKKWLEIVYTDDA